MTATAVECIVVETHFVGDYANAPVKIPAVAPARFERLIDDLMRSHEPVGPDDLQRFFRDGADLPPRCFFLSFDDGIRDHITNVLPILRKRGLKGAFYIPGSVLDEHVHLPLLERQRFLQYSWPTYRVFLDQFVEEVLESLPGISSANIAPSGENFARMGDYLGQYAFYSTEERFYRYIRDKILTPPQFSLVINRLFMRRFPAERALVKSYYVSADDILQLHEAGMTIGGHGFAHEHLPRMDDQKADIERGLAMLATVIGERPSTMSYPFGSYDQRTLALMRELDIDFAFTTGNKVATLDRSRPYEIHRMDISTLLS